jgi:hypothetical protein
VPSKNCTNGLTIQPQMEILRAKAKSSALLTSKLEQSLSHLKNPKYVPINNELLVDILQRT